MWEPIRLTGVQVMNDSAGKILRYFPGCKKNADRESQHRSWSLLASHASPQASCGRVLRALFRRNNVLLLDGTHAGYHIFIQTAESAPAGIAARFLLSQGERLLMRSTGLRNLICGTDSHRKGGGQTGRSSVSIRSKN